ncbi:MAG: TonB-dependent receptor [Verrucomicrobia bacterium]|nr:TonB-dependent receptor [Verrucomicrobiota bacterium]
MGFLFGIIAFTFSASLFAQTDSGSITGTVIESWEGKPLPGVTVTIRGTTLATTTDPQGRFQVNQVQPGEHTLRFSKSGYAAATVTEVRVLAGQQSKVDGVLRPEFYEMEEYEVTAEEFQEQAVQLLQDRQQASSMLDAVGSEMFRNLAVSDAAQALSKITGATVADGKYAVVRGLADRYTFTTMNGMELPSADPDRKAFQLDLLPTKFIQQVDVRKTFSPEMSGGFAGGSIDIVSKSYPENFLFEFRLDTAYNTQSSLRNDFAASDRSSTDRLGFDDGLRALPPEAAASRAFGTGAPLDPAIKSKFDSIQFAPLSMNSPLDAGMSLLLGDTKKVLGKRVGFLAGFEYKNDYRFYENGVVRNYDQRGFRAAVDKTDTRGVINYNWASLANLSLELNEQHHLKFNFMYVQAAEDEARRLQGFDDNLSTEPGESYVEQNLLHWTQRSLSYFQWAGTHEFPSLKDVRFDWGASLSTTSQDEPDQRIFQFFASPGVPDFDPNSGSSVPNRPVRFWRDLAESNQNLRGDFTIPLPSYNSQENRIKTGLAYSQSERDFTQRGFDVRANTRRHPFYTRGDPNLYLIPDHLPFIDYFNFPANTTYEGGQSVGAGYILAGWAVLEWLQLAGGARYETTDISIDAFDQTGNRPLTPGAIQQSDLLPSLSAKIQIRENVDLRAAWSRTVVRPTYREIAAVPIHDITRNRTYFGNPDLTLTSSENFDLRASWYPRPSEILSVSLFAKTIGEAIEQTSIRNDNTLITYANSDEADVRGVEAEMRVGLDRLWATLKPLTLGFNAAYIESEVPLTPTQQANRRLFGEFETSRPLYDQPSYILNADLTWDIERTRTSVTLSGGVVGERLVLVGLGQPDDFVAPAPDLNLFVRQKLGRHWDVQFTARNLFNPAYEIVQTWPDARRVVLQSYTKGMTFGLSVGCEF